MRWRQRTLQHRSLYCPRCVVVSAVLSGIRPVRSGDTFPSFLLSYSFCIVSSLGKTTRVNRGDD